MDDSQVDPHQIIVMCAWKKIDPFDCSEIRNASETSGPSLHTAVLIRRNRAAIYPLVLPFIFFSLRHKKSPPEQLNESSREWKGGLCVCVAGQECVFACFFFFFAKCLHMCTVELTAVGYNLLQSKWPKNKEMENEKQRGEGGKKCKRLQSCFDFSASKPVTLSPSRRKTGNSSVTLTLICKSSLSPIHFKFSLTLDSATSAISGCADNARLQSLSE